MCPILKIFQGTKIIRSGLVVMAGAALGFMYYHFIGCLNGCPLTSNPWTSMLAGGAMAYLLTDKSREGAKKGSSNDAQGENTEATKTL
jgi:hypothetical protein